MFQFRNSYHEHASHSVDVLDIELVARVTVHEVNVTSQPSIVLLESPDLIEQADGAGQPWMEAARSRFAQRLDTAFIINCATGQSTQRRTAVSHWIVVTVSFDDRVVRARVRDSMNAKLSKSKYLKWAARLHQMAVATDQSPSTE